MLEGRWADFHQARWPKMPVLRSLVGLVEMVGLALSLHSKNGLRRALGLAAGWSCTSCSTWPSVWFSPRGTQYAAGSVLLGVASLVFAMFALRKGLGKRVWRYHGAEHKAVNANEHGADLRTGAVRDIAASTIVAAQT